MIFSSHIVSDIERLANRIWILKEGRLDWQGDLDSLKESIVRLHLRGCGRNCSDALEIPGALSVRREGDFATAVVRDWTPQAARARRQIARAIEVEVEVARPRGNLPGAASMNAVARLVWLYFTGTPMTRALSFCGILSCLISLYVVSYLPQSEHMLAFAQGGQLMFFLGSSLMPVMVGRLAQGHTSGVLPHGRWKLLSSMLLTVFIVALPAGILTPFAFVAGMSEPASALGGHPKLVEYTINMAWVIYTSSVIIAGWLYLVMWFLSQRNVAGFAKGMLVIVILMFMPAREIRGAERHHAAGTWSSSRWRGRCSACCSWRGRD